MIVFGSRGSDLALTQTRVVAEQVKQATGVDYRIEVLVTTGDRIQDKPLSGIGIKGLFTRELEDALRDGSIDLAVHSLKDLPVQDPKGITLGAVPARENPADVLITSQNALRAGAHASPLEQLAGDKTLGTSSPRRSLAALIARPDLIVKDIRGNVPTRIDKARRGDYDAVLLAAAGLNRLGSDLSDLVTEELSCSVFTPAPGQGALGIQCRSGDERILAAISHVHDDVTARCVNAERDVLFGLGGGCSMPLGVLIDPLDQGFRLRAALFGGTPNAALRTASIGEDPKAMAADVVSAWQPLVGAPLRGLRIATIRPDGERSGLTAALAIAGAEVTALPWTTTAAIRADHGQLESLIDCDALAFTSTRAVRHFTTQCREHGLSPTSHPTFAVGAATATELIQLGYLNVTRAAGRGGKALADMCQMKGISSGQSIGLPCALERHPEFEQQAARAGIEVRALPCYQLLAVETPSKPPTALDAFLFTSPSAVKAWLQHAPQQNNVRAIAIGTTTTIALKDRGITSVTTLQDPTPNALINALQAPGDQGHA